MKQIKKEISSLLLFPTLWLSYESLTINKKDLFASSLIELSSTHCSVQEILLILRSLYAKVSDDWDKKLSNTGKDILTEFDLVESVKKSLNMIHVETGSDFCIKITLIIDFATFLSQTGFTRMVLPVF